MLSRRHRLKVQDQPELLRELQNDFKDRPEEWKLVIGNDLSMKFNNPEVLFATGSAELTPKFKSILDEFLPKYIDILINDSLCTHIKEIRIEGHTDDVKFAGSNTDPFIDNARLSQQRSLAVLTYLRQMPALKKYTPDQQKMLEYWFTANGLSYGKSLDKDGEYTFISKKPIDRNLSRRVEFRIVTDAEKVIEEVANKNK